MALSYPLNKVNYEYRKTVNSPLEHGTRERRWRGTRTCRSTPVCASTSVIPLSTEAQTKTPTGCCVSTLPRAPTSVSTSRRPGGRGDHPQHQTPKDSWLEDTCRDARPIPTSKPYWTCCDDHLNPPNMHRTRIALPSQGRRNDLIDEPQGRLLRQRPNGEPIPTLKTELDNPRQYATRADAQRDIFNRTRLQTAIG